MASNSSSETNTYDVIICGAGLAGLTLARQLRLRLPELSVLLLDKLTSPLRPAAFKVGESTVEMGAYYLAHVVQLEDYLERRHLPKLGLRYFFGDSQGPFEERPELGLSGFAPVRSYQLDRGVLENDLRRFNAESGVQLLESCIVQDIVLSENDETHVVHYTQKGASSPQTARARWVVDAMGRRRLIQKKLSLGKERNEKFSAAWFRVPWRFDLSDFVPQTDRCWHQRVPEKIRYYSTNHLMGDGYWVWLIPLSSGTTSVGIVAYEDLHRFSQYNTYERARAWLAKHEPIVDAHLGDCQPLDFLVMGHYSYSSQQVFSTHRWACVGEAGVFSDPFYSPGTDEIGLANCLTQHLIELDRAGKLAEEAVEEANLFFLSYHEGVSRNIHAGYPYMGTDLVMALKLLWDFVASWSFSSPLMFNSLFGGPEGRSQIRKVSGRFIPLSHRMQQLFSDWSRKSLRRGTFTFIDYLSIPFIRDLRLRNLKPNKTTQELIDDQAANMQTVEKLAQVIFLLAVEDTFPSALPLFPAPVWLNAWAVSLDVRLWEADGLFNPTSEPLDLSSISEQLRANISFPSAHAASSSNFSV